MFCCLALTCGEENLCPGSLNPKSKSHKKLNPKHQIPKTLTLNPKLKNLKPKPYTLNALNFPKPLLKMAAEVLHHL